MRLKFLATIMAAFVISTVAYGVSFAMPSEANSDTTQLTKVFPAEMSLPAEAWGIPLTFGFGSTTDFVADRNLDNGADLDENLWTGGNIYYDPDPRVHLSLFLGSAWLRVGSVPIDTDTTTKVTLDADAAFAVGTGVKVDVTDFEVIPDQPKMNLFVSGGYRHTNSDVREVDGGGFNDRSQSLELEINEWQGTVGVSQRINDPLKLWFGWTWCNFAWVPYLAVQYSDLDLNVSGQSQLPNSNSIISQSVQTGHVNSDGVVNLVVGMQVIGFGDKLSIDLEGRMLAESALTLGAHFRW